MVITLANTQEVLFLKNRSGNAPSHSGAAAYMDAAVTLVRQGGFRRVHAERQLHLPIDDN